MTDTQIQSAFLDSWKDSYPRMMRCQQCRGIDFKVIESRLLLSGTRRRRWRCNNCANRWTTRQNGASPPRERRPMKPLLRGGVRSLTNAEAASIMVSTFPVSELAKQYDMTHQSISAIKSGRNYRDVFSALGLSRKGCHSCQHWSREGCSFDFPEAGGSFSKHCTLYEPHAH